MGLLVAQGQRARCGQASAPGRAAAVPGTGLASHAPAPPRLPCAAPRPQVQRQFPELDTPLIVGDADGKAYAVEALVSLTGASGGHRRRGLGRESRARGGGDATGHARRRGMVRPLAGGVPLPHAPRPPQELLDEAGYTCLVGLKG